MTFPHPEITELNRAYWDGLREGRLRFQRCLDCQHGWLPARRNCPNCLSSSFDWVDSDGKGQVVSWVVYHRAYADFLKDKVPYDVSIVELDEGPRLLTNVIDSDAGRKLSVGARVELDVTQVDDTALATFRLGT